MLATDMDADDDWPDLPLLLRAGLAIAPPGAHAEVLAVAQHVTRAAAGYGALLVIALAYRAVRGREGLGLGDAKLLGGLGAWMGWQALPFILLCASMLGLVVMLTSGRASHAAARAPLGTFLALAALPGWLIAVYLLR